MHTTSAEASDVASHQSVLGEFRRQFLTLPCAELAEEDEAARQVTAEHAGISHSTIPGGVVSAAEDDPWTSDDEPLCLPPCLRKKVPTHKRGDPNQPPPPPTSAMAAPRTGSVADVNTWLSGTFSDDRPRTVHDLLQTCRADQPNVSLDAVINVLRTPAFEVKRSGFSRASIAHASRVTLHKQHAVDVAHKSSLPDSMIQVVDPAGASIDTNAPSEFDATPFLNTYTNSFDELPPSIAGALIIGSLVSVMCSIHTCTPCRCHRWLVWCAPYTRVHHAVAAAI